MEGLDILLNERHGARCTGARVFDNGTEEEETHRLSWRQVVSCRVGDDRRGRALRQLTADESKRCKVSPLLSRSFQLTNTGARRLFILFPLSIPISPIYSRPPPPPPPRYRYDNLVATRRDEEERDRRAPFSVSRVKIPRRPCPFVSKRVFGYRVCSANVQPRRLHLVAKKI